MLEDVADNQKYPAGRTIYPVGLIIVPLGK
jgi:hypothetical protein